MKVPIFFIRRLASRKVYQKGIRGGLSFKKIDDDVTAQKPSPSRVTKPVRNICFCQVRMSRLYLC
jgi:hypothetical protein